MIPYVSGLVRAPRLEATLLLTICVLVMGPRSFPHTASRGQSMLSLLRRAFAFLCSLLDLNDHSENRLHPVHGWLLPDAVVVRERNATPIVPRAGSPVRFEGGR
jgi:hypothetical protein